MIDILESPAAGARVARLLTEGGDARIRLNPADGLNQYLVAPRPTHGIAYASSTANEISEKAFAHLQRRLATLDADGGITPQAYAEALESLRRRIRQAYVLDAATEIIFAPSGTDLEYVGLALVKERGAGGIHNVLLGADEVGSGCIYSARGQYFANETARDIAVAPGQPIGGRITDRISLIDVPVRHEDGAALHPHEVAERIDGAIRAARAVEAHTLVHVVHGSKTGLVLPALVDIDALQARHAGHVTFIVDACQARITSAAIADYLARGITVLLTGSKFMGGPPFSGIALVPHERVINAALMPIAFCKLFRQAEWPSCWPDAGLLARETNPGLLMRLEAAIFELERFQSRSLAEVSRVILAFHAAVRATFVDRLGGRRVAPYAPGERAEGDSHPIEMRTLSTIDISRLPGQPDFEEARRIHKALATAGVRVGQPVKCVKLADGRWGGTLRVGISMPQVSEMSPLDDGALAARLTRDMSAIVDAIEDVRRR